MKIKGKQTLARVFVGERDQWNGLPLYEAIVSEARRMRMAGATVTKGCMGFGRGAHIHTSKLLELSYDMPMVVEIVDTEKNVKKLLPKLDKMVEDGLVTLEKVRVVLYRSNKAGAKTPKPRGK